MRLSYRVNIFSRPRIAALVIKSHETDNNTTHTHTHIRAFGATAKGFLHTPQATPQSPLSALHFTPHSLAITYPNMPLGNYS